MCVLHGLRKHLEISQDIYFDCLCLRTLANNNVPFARKTIENLFELTFVGDGAFHFDGMTGEPDLRTRTFSRSCAEH